MPRSTLALLILCAVVVPEESRPQQRPTRDAALDVIDAFDRIARRDLWPGFRPDTIPLATFDGTRTWLVRHPAPPPEFLPSQFGARVLIMDGRHPEVTANSSAKIGGRTVATLIPKLTERDATAWASVAAHEAFHAYQRTRHTTWQANEATLFTYPWENVDALAMRRLEFEALRRALAAADDAATVCWARAAMGEREARFAAIGSDAAAYESRSELNEGTAQYVQLRAAGTDALSAMPAEEFAPPAVRARAYAAGGAMGQLLDRLHPSWRRELDLADSTASFHGTLERAAAGGSKPGCEFTAAERDRALANAARDIEEQGRALAAIGAEYLNKPGWSVVVEAGARVLNAGGFDPLNVARLSAATVLHSRYVRLVNDAGEFASINQPVLTESAGSHPLFSGVRRVVVTGLDEPPAVDESGGAVTVKAGELTLTFRGASLDRDGQRLTVRLSAR